MINYYEIWCIILSIFFISVLYIMDFFNKYLKYKNKYNAIKKKYNTVENWFFFLSYLS